MSHVAAKLSVAPRGLSCWPGENIWACFFPLFPSFSLRRRVHYYWLQVTMRHINTHLQKCIMAAHGYKRSRDQSKPMRAIRMAPGKKKYPCWLPHTRKIIRRKQVFKESKESQIMYMWSASRVNIDVEMQSERARKRKRSQRLNNRSGGCLDESSREIGAEGRRQTEDNAEQTRLMADERKMTAD